MARISGFHNFKNRVYLKDVKTSGTGGGTFNSGSYQTRTLNTLENPHSVTWISLLSNQFTLQPGSYVIKATCPAFRVNLNKCRLYNVSDATTAILGDVSYTDTSNDDATVVSSLKGKIEITSPKVFEIQHRCQNTHATNGFGISSGFGDSEIYTIVEIEKVA